MPTSKTLPHLAALSPTHDTKELSKSSSLDGVRELGNGRALPGHWATDRSLNSTGRQHVPADPPTISSAHHPDRKVVRRRRDPSRRSASRGRPPGGRVELTDHGRGRSRTRHTGARKHGRRPGTCDHLDVPCPPCLSIRNGGRHRVADGEGCCLALFPFAPGTGAAGKIAPCDRYFGGPANSGRWLCVPLSREVCPFDCYLS